MTEEVGLIAAVAEEVASEEAVPEIIEDTEMTLTEEEEEEDREAVVLQVH